LDIPRPPLSAALPPSLKLRRAGLVQDRFTIDYSALALSGAAYARCKQ